MGEQDHMRAGLTRRIGDEGVTGGAGGGLEAGRGFVARPVQGLPVGADGPRLRTGADHPGGAVGIQPVIDGERQQASPGRPRPIDRDMQQSDGIAAAGQGDGDRMIDMGFEPAVEDRPRLRQPARNDRAQPGLRAGGRAAGAAQAKRVRISVARERSAAEEVSA